MELPPTSISLSYRAESKLLSAQPAPPAIATPKALPGRPNATLSSPLFPVTLPSFIQQTFIEHLRCARYCPTPESGVGGDGETVSETMKKLIIQL